MNNERVWDEKSRADLRDRLRWVVLGELRLAKNGRADILDICREVHLSDDCPEDEVQSFIQFVSEELDRIATNLVNEKTQWPSETDCDRLDRVEAKLCKRGIVLWQASPCCDTCTLGELSDRIDVVNGRHPGFADQLRGYSFFIDQNMAESLADNTHITVCLAYGWCSPDGSEVAQDAYNQNALGIAHEVCDCLRDEGFKIEWDEDLSRKICISLNWQRRTLLE